MTPIEGVEIDSGGCLRNPIRLPVWFLLEQLSHQLGKQGGRCLAAKQGGEKTFPVAGDHQTGRGSAAALDPPPSPAAELLGAVEQEHVSWSEILEQTPSGIRGQPSLAAPEGRLANGDSSLIQMGAELFEQRRLAAAFRSHKGGPTIQRFEAF